ncbi:ABC transporter substrate-binding protein [Nonomuraea sp. NPDC049714]|uniref:ABC transporter substrate-binding protein n=1 Tax=Nonomuraea sp. NPDC049714 TaxID=3364357 RepID=UPI0037B0FAED
MPNTPHPSLSLSRRSFLKRSALTVGMAAAGSGLLAACGSDEPTGAEAEGGLKPFTFLSGIPLETLSMAIELYAVAGGFFAKHGLDVTLQPTKGTSQAMQTLLSGVAPVTRLGQMEVMSAITDSNQPLINIGTCFRTSAVRFVYSKERHPVEKPEDLVGQTMGVPSEGGNSDKVVSLVMAAGGLDPKQCKRQVVGLTPGTFSLVKQGRIVGYVTTVDVANILVGQDPDVGVFDPAKYAKADAQVYVTTKDALVKDAEDLRKFLAGVNDSLAALVADTNFDKAIPILREKYSFATLDDDKIARASLTMLRNGWMGGDMSGPLLTSDEEAWTAGYKELVDAGMVKAGGTPASWYDNSLLPKT